MKRSEMLSIIESVLTCSVNIRLQSRFDMDESAVAREILSAIEEAGMYPPDTTVEKHECNQWDNE